MLEWDHRTDAIAAAGTSFEKNATADELKSLAAQYAIPAVERVAARYTIKPTSDGRYRAKGRFSVTFVQACVVSLDPVETAVDELFEIEFRPKQQVDENDLGLDDDSALETEAFDRDRVPIGKVLTELIALAIPPFPRAGDAQLENATVGDGDDAEEELSPFAALEALKEKLGGEEK